MNPIARYLLLADRARGKAEVAASPAQREELDRLARQCETRAIERILGVPVVLSDAEDRR